MNRRHSKPRFQALRSTRRREAAMAKPMLTPWRILIGSMALGAFAAFLLSLTGATTLLHATLWGGLIAGAVYPLAASCNSHGGVQPDKNCWIGGQGKPDSGDCGGDD